MVLYSKDGFNGNSAGQIYYTYNPAQGTRYLVENPV